MKKCLKKLNLLNSDATLGISRGLLSSFGIFMLRINIRPTILITTIIIIAELQQLFLGSFS